MAPAETGRRQTNISVWPIDLYCVYTSCNYIVYIYRVACVMMTDEREKRWITIGRVWCVSVLSISATKVWRQCAAAITNDLMAWLERTKTSTWYCAAHRSFYSRAWVTHDRALRFCRERGRREKKNPFPSAFFEGSRTAHSTCYYASIVVKPLDCYRITMPKTRKENWKNSFNKHKEVQNVVLYSFLVGYRGTRIPFCGVIDLIIQTTTTKKCVCKKTRKILRIEFKEEAKRKSKQQQCHGPPMDLTEQQQTAKCIYR